VAADNKIGRFIADAVSSMPKLSPSSFDRLFNDRIQVTTFLFDASDKWLPVLLAN
jgi:hypothetical protein